MARKFARKIFHLFARACGGCRGSGECKNVVVLASAVKIAQAQAVAPTAAVQGW